MQNNNFQQINPSTLETVDFAVYDWVDSILDISVNTNEGFKKVPVVWLSQERVFQIKNGLEFKDFDNQSIVYPYIVIKRESFVNTPAGERPIPANIFPKKDYKRGSFRIAHKIIQQEKTSNFVNADSYRSVGQINFRNKNKVPAIVYESWYIDYPVYHTISYKITARTNYQEQINEILQNFARSSGGINLVNISHDIHHYEAFKQDGTSTDNSENLGEEEKYYEYSFELKVLGYTTTIGDNKLTPVYVVRESPAKIRFQRERSLFNEKNENGVPIRD